MKSAHRHQLETNELAQRLDVVIERARPYAATVAGVIVAIVVVMFIWSYISGSTASRRAAAWDAYHQGVAAVPPDLDQLRRSAEEYPGTQMQHMANVTWADGQVWIAARDYIYNRPAAMEALNRATSAYESVLQRSDNERLQSRAHLGLARVYEMQNELDKAREEYLKVGGGYEEYAKQQAERLEEPETKEAYEWLATAEPPRTRPPAGPGTPGERPEFSAGDFPLPGAATEGAPQEGVPGQSFEEMLKGFDLGFPAAEEADRYDTGSGSPATEQTPASENAPATEEATVGEDATATDNAATNSEPAAPTDPDANEPAGEKAPTE